MTVAERIGLNLKGSCRRACISTCLERTSVREI